PRVRRPPECRGPRRAARPPPRSAVRRLQCGAHVPAERGDTRRGHGRALRRRWRRAVRRLRALRRRADGSALPVAAGPAARRDPRLGRAAAGRRAAWPRRERPALRTRRRAGAARRLSVMDLLHPGSRARRAAGQPRRRVGAQSRTCAVDAADARGVPAAGELVSVGALYICYLGLADPLVRTQVVAYLAGLAERGHRIHLLTFETDLSRARRRELRAEMA